MEDDADQETKTFAMDLIKKSVRQASAKLTPAGSPSVLRARLVR